MSKLQIEMMVITPIILIIINMAILGLKRYPFLLSILMLILYNLA